MEKVKNFEVRDMRHKEKFMMDDTYLNGYAKLCGVYATAVYVSLCRHVDREQKCWPSHEKIAEEHNISSRQVIRALKILLEKNIVKQERIGKKANNRYWLLDKSEWTNSQFSDVTNSQFIGDQQSVHHVTNSQFHSKDTHIKETHSKDTDTITIASDGKDIQDIISLFKEVNPSYSKFFANKTQRSAVSRLLIQWPRPQLDNIIKVLQQTNKEQYAPTITTPLQLEDNIGKLKAFIQKNRTNQKGKTIIGL